MNVLELIKSDKIIAIARNVDIKDIIDVADALYSGGIRLLEVTFEPQNPDSVKNTCKKIELLREKFKGKMGIGAGTVLEISEAKEAIKSGAQYIISPNTNAQVIEYTVSCDIVSIPGAMTPTEIAYAYEKGANAVKLFPAGSLGTGYIKSIRGPLSHIPIIATGGINDTNLKDFLDTGIAGVGIGGNIVDKKIIRERRFSELKNIALSYTSQI